MPVTSGASTRVRRDAARADDRSRNGVARQAFVIACLNAVLWARRLAQVTTGADLATAALGLAATTAAAFAVVVRLDLTVRTNELTRRLRIEREVARRLRRSGRLALHDRTIDGSPPLSHLVIGPGRVVVVVDASSSRWAPWRRSAGHGTATTPVWNAWLDASAGAVALRTAVADVRLSGGTPTIEPAVIVDMSELPVWAQRLSIYDVDQLAEVSAIGADDALGAFSTEDATTLFDRVRTLTRAATDRAG